MKNWTRVGLALGVAVILGGMAVGALTWAQDATRLEFGRQTSGFRLGEGSDFGNGRRMGARLLAMLDSDHVKTALGLTDDQTSRLRQIVVDTQKSNITTGSEMAVRGIELRELLRADNPDRDSVMKKIDQISALRTEMLKQDVDALLKAKTVLTPEQQKKIRTFIENHRAGNPMGGGAFGGRGMGPGAHPPDNPPSPRKSPDSPQE